MPSAGADRSRSSPPGLLVAAIVVGVVALDQCTKVWAVARLSDGPIAVLGDDIGFRLSRNSGGAFSILGEYTPVLALLAVVLTGVLVRAVVRTDDRLMLVALALVLAGVVGNLVDRLVRSPGFLRGEVVDFVGVRSFPTFNVADSAITVGTVLLVVAVLRTPDTTPEDSPPTDPGAPR
ncbi:MAG: signal peptidase II [Actinomycetota bacterium]